MSVGSTELHEKEGSGAGGLRACPVRSPTLFLKFAFYTTEHWYFA